MPVTRKVDADLDFSGVGRLLRALMNPVASDPSSPNPGEVWFNTADNRFKVRGTSGTIVLATLDDVTAGSITGGLWDAQSVVTAVTDNNPAPQVLAPSTILGRRATGDITAVSFANLLADLETIGITAADLQGSTLAQVVARANHTGTQLSSTISDFNTAVDARAQAIVDSMVGAAPAALDTLFEIAEALNNDPDFAATLNAQIAAKAGRFAMNVGNATDTLFTIPHNLGTTDVIVATRVNATGQYFDAFWDAIDANNVQVGFNTVYAAAAVRVVVLG